MAKTRLRLRITSGPELSPAEVEECVEVRRSVMRFKPDTDLVEDSAAARNAVQRSEHVFLLVDDAGGFHGFTLFQVHEPAGRAGPIFYEVVHSYSRPSARGTPLLTWMLVRVGMTVLGRGLGRERWMFGLGVYPQSYRLACRYGDQCGNTFDPRVPEHVRRVIFAAAADRYGPRWDPERHLVRLRTLPAEMPPGWLERERGEAWWQEYQRINPDWEQGWGAVFVSPVRMNDVMRAMGGVVRRRIQRREAR